jgi:hypothetical protein
VLKQQYLLLFADCCWNLFDTNYFILTGALVVVDSGDDKLEELNKKGSNLIRGVSLYFVVATLASLSLYFLDNCFVWIFISFIN